MFSERLRTCEENSHHMGMRYLIWIWMGTVTTPNCLRGGQMRWIEFHSLLQMRSYTSSWPWGTSTKRVSLLNQNGRVSARQVPSLKSSWNLVSRYLISSEYVCDCKGLLEIPQRRPFRGCKIHVSGFAASTEALVETFAREILFQMSAIYGTGDQTDAWKTMCRALVGVWARNLMVWWRIRGGIWPIKMFS